jgi:hypothetical protein
MDVIFRDRGRVMVWGWRNETLAQTPVAVGHVMGGEGIELIGARARHSTASGLAVPPGNGHLNMISAIRGGGSGGRILF